MKRITETLITWNFHFGRAYAKVGHAQIVACEAWLKKGCGELTIGLEQTGLGFTETDHQSIRKTLELPILCDVAKVVHRNENSHFHYVSLELMPVQGKDFTDTALDVFIAAMMLLRVTETTVSLPIPSFTTFDWVEINGERMTWGEFKARQHYGRFYKVPDMR